MILANVRSRLRAADLELAVRALAHRHPERRSRYEARLAAEGPDAVLDEPDLVAALRELRSLAEPSAPLFVYVAVRHTLRSGGLDDPEVADYLAALVLEFGDHDRHARIGRHDDQSYHYLVDLVADLATDEGERGFLLRVHLGNYSLWLAGLFPDRIAARRARAGGPDLPYYDELGRQGYDLAARHPLADRFGTAALYRSVADRFPALRQALNHLSDRVFFPDVVTPDKILRLM
ncbi:MAG TPA: hypothetical protein VD707_02465 [Gemmatimonadales bacterium]|jgi:hypothetical protein|nr:hypothetical protein [Gemmatimonadales bacterium]